MGIEELNSSVYGKVIIICLIVMNYKQKDDSKATESTHFVGKAIVALSNDPERMVHTGKILTTSELSRLYGFIDIDGGQPEYFSITDKSNGILQREEKRKRGIIRLS